MILINNIDVSLDYEFSALTSLAANKLKISEKNIIICELYRRSVDARKKDNVHFCISLKVKTDLNEEKIIKRVKNASIFTEKPYVWKKYSGSCSVRPVVVGFGPAGMFAALVLAKAGLKPIVIERGKDADTRTKDVENFFNGGTLDTESNIQFGEGGAGTFSDGKLNSGIKDPRCRTVLETFTYFGAPQNICTDSKPHIGTDILVDVVKNIREEIISLGGEVRFSSKLEDIISNNNSVCSVVVNGENIPCNALVLATGHSARDTFAMLKDRNISMIRKPFAMGVRIEHLQSDIDSALYGKFAGHPALKAADYKLAVHLPDGRGVYTFCMCPGGYVINASSECGGVAVNGMSYNRRDGVNAISAVLVSVAPEDIAGDDVLAGCFLQRKIEETAYRSANGAVPITTVGHFVYGEKAQIGKVKPTVRPLYDFCELSDIYPEFIVSALKDGILLMNKKLHGFADPQAILTAPETRSSSPIRIVRDESGSSVSLKGLFPSGEGAGYAGGIMSAAVDGMRSAEKLIEYLESFD